MAVQILADYCRGQILIRLRIIRHLYWNGQRSNPHGLLFPRCLSVAARLQPEGWIRDPGNGEEKGLYAFVSRLVSDPVSGPFLRS